MLGKCLSFRVDRGGVLVGFLSFGHCVNYCRNLPEPFHVQPIRSGAESGDKVTERCPNKGVPAPGI